MAKRSGHEALNHSVVGSNPAAGSVLWPWVSFHPCQQCMGASICRRANTENTGQMNPWLGAEFAFLLVAQCQMPGNFEMTNRLLHSIFNSSFSLML